MLRLRKFMFQRVYLGPEARGEHERVQRTLRGLFDHYMRSRGAPGAGPDEDPVQGVDRLHRGDDRPLLHRPLQADRAAGGVEAVSARATFSDSRRSGGLASTDEPAQRRHDRAGPGGGGHRRDRLGVHRPAAGRGAVRGCARSTRSGRRRSRWTRARSSTTASGARAGGDVIKFVREQEGLRFPEAVEALAERYGVELEREQEDPRLEEQRRRRARLAQVLERTAAYYASYLWESAEGGEGEASICSRGGWGRRCCARLGSGARRPSGARCWRAGSRRGSTFRS